MADVRQRSASSSSSSSSEERVRPSGPRRIGSRPSSRERSRSRERPRSRSRSRRDRSRSRTGRLRSRSRTGGRRSRSRSRSRIRRSRGRSTSVRSAVGRLRNLDIGEQGERRDQEDDSYRFFQKLLNQQQERIAGLLADQKQELFDKVDNSKKHNFKQKPLEKQHEVNDKFLKIVRRSISCLEKAHTSKAKTYLKELKEELEEHSEDIIAADISRHGWLTVSRIRDRGSLSSAVIRRIEKEDDNIDKRRKSVVGQTSKRPGVMDKPPFRDPFRPDSFRTTRPQPGQKKSPEQLLNEAVRQTRAGLCSHCQQEGHFY